MGKKLGSLRRISIEMRSHIFEAALKKEKRAKSRSVLADELEAEFGDKSPSLNTLEKLISEARNHPVSPLDEQWSVGSLAQYDIPPEALPAVMYIYEKRQRELEIDFTIREALWIARLHKTIDDLDVLERFANAYAVKDQMDWILDCPVNTRGFDFLLINYNNKERRAETIAQLERPYTLSPRPSSFSPGDSLDDLQTRLKQKGYDFEAPEMIALRKHTEEVWQQVVQVTEQARAELEQKKPEELTEDEAQYLKWAKKWLEAKGGIT